MKIKKLLLATIASFVFLFLTGWLWWGSLMASWYEAHPGATGLNLSRADMPIMLYLSAGLLLHALILSYLFEKGFHKGNHIMEGIRFGVCIGLMAGLGSGLIIYGTSEIVSRSTVLMDSVWMAVQYGLAGIVIAAVYGKPEAK